MTTTRQHKDRMAFDRSDHIGLRIILWGIFGVVLGGLVLGPVSAWVSGGPLGVPFVSDITVPALERVGTEYGQGDYLVEVTDLSTLDYVVALVPGLLALALVGAGVLLVQRVARDIAAGTPFVAAQVTRLRWLAGILLVGAPLVTVLQLAADGFVLGQQDLGGLGPVASLDLPLLPMAAGLVLALLAEAFKAGGRLQDDVEGLV